MSDELVSWLKSIAIPCPTADAGDALRVLNQTASSAEVVFLGEMNHFVHEKSDFRLLFARHFFRLGWSSFMEEVGWSDGWRIDRYMADGDPGWFERLSLFGYRGDARGDRDDRPTGIFKTAFEAYPHDLMRSEAERFYRGMRLAATRPLRFFGIDIDAEPGGTYADVVALLAPSLSLAGVAPWQAKYNRVAGENIDQELQRLGRAKATLPTSIEGHLHAELCMTIDALQDSLRYVQLTYDAKSYEDTRPGMAFREEAMKRRYAAARASSGEAKSVLMSHALHLAKDDRLIESMGGIGPGGGRVASLGHHIVQDLGKNVFSIWMIYGSGEDSQPFSDLPRLANFPADTLNARLAAFDTPTLFMLQRAPPDLLDKPVKIGHMYNTTFRTKLRGQVDALFYLPCVSPLRLS